MLFVSAVQQSESVTRIHIAPLPWLSFPFRSLQNTEFPVLYSRFPLVVYFIHSRGHPTPVLLPGKSRGWRSLVGCSLWGHQESDMTERLHFHFSLSCIGEGNGIPLQCPCLENPRDKGAWWAAVYGVTQSDTTEAT